MIVVALCIGTATARAQKAYETPRKAVDAFVAAVESRDDAAMRTVLGDDFRQVLAVHEVDRADVDQFLADYRKEHRIERESDDRAILEAGGDGWTLPIPIVKRENGWVFDTRQGRAEMRKRRIGRNELAVQQAILAYYDAQKEYAQADWNGDGRPEYAQKLISTPGKHDGLYWEAKPGEPESALGPLLANKTPGSAYHGYRYKILKSQGANAPGGARSYLVNGRMIDGFALVAWPARYGDTGVMTFVISSDGKVYQKDLGPGTNAAASNITSYDPDSSWERVETPGQ
jgi:hypothetical protein